MSYGRYGEAYDVNTKIRCKQNSILRECKYRNWKKHCIREIGKVAWHWRLEHQYPASRIAEIAGYSVQAIYQFEHGENNNYVILCAYVMLGFDIAESLDLKELYYGKTKADDSRTDTGN